MLDRLLLFPYSLTLAIRNRIYRKGSRKLVKASVPTICVGNITAGGTGKTPHTELILRMLQESDKWGQANIAMLSRGYKRSSKGFQQVMPFDSAKMSGDEPLQIKKKFPGVTVAVHKDRIEACGLLTQPDKLPACKGARRCVHKEFPAADVIVLDDAYQYRKLAADLNIVLVDYNRPVTKDSLLPFGRLRDLPKRLYDAEVVVVTKCPSYMSEEDKLAMAKLLKYKEYDPQSSMALTPKGNRQVLLFSYIRYEQSVPVYDTTDQRYRYSQQLILFSGIAKDTPLVNFLSDHHKVVWHHSFPDHHNYKRADVSKILSAVRRHPTATVATTEKDAQRILDYSAMPEMLSVRMFMIPIAVDFISERERELFRDIVTSV